MIESRRAFLKNFFVAGVASQIPLTGLMDANISTDTSLIKDYLFAFQKAWTRHQYSDSDQYLAALPTEVWKSKDLLNKLIQNEFRDNRTIEVEGLIMSQTEVAITINVLNQTQLSAEG